MDTVHSPPPLAEPPVIMAVDDEPLRLARMSRELARRYGADYRVRCANSPVAALADLAALRVARQPVALVMADQWMEEMTGSDFLEQVADLHPGARRGLLVEWGAWSDARTSQAILRAMALGHMDYYVLKPWATPDESFHRTIVEFLHEWRRTDAASQREVVVVAERWSPRGAEIRSLLSRNGIPHAVYMPDTPAGRRELDRANRSDASRPIVLIADRVLDDPSNAAIGDAYGVRTTIPSGGRYDVAVIGAGPAGLAASVYASSEGLSTVAVEREAVGGQAGSSSLIRNYLGFSRGVSGSELAMRAYQQAWVFGTQFVHFNEVARLDPGAGEGGDHVITLDHGVRVSAGAVVLATGASYRRLPIPALDDLVGRGVFYGASVAEAPGLAGESVYVVGTGNSAGQAATHLARYAGKVTLLCRGDSPSASMSRYLVDQCHATGNIEFRMRTQVADAAGDTRLRELVLRDRDGVTERVEAAALFVLIGAVPNTAWLPDAVARDDGGFLLTGEHLPDWPLARAPKVYETSVPRVFAVGDARHGSVQRVASAVGEGSVVVQQVHACLDEDAMARSLA